MRPVALELEGFTCFKERQVVAFDGLDLFAIWGPTGAGKTSLLDGMVFALYGCVPRLGERRNRDVISLTRDRAAVVFEFDAGRRRYRVVRAVRRAGAGQAKLEDGDGNTLADGVREVDARLRECLGLSYDAFVQAVVLPQGEFARFLKSEPRARREILRGLLRLDVYERMRARAEERRRDLDGRLLTIGRVLEEYADASPDRVEELGRRLATAREARQAAEAAREGAAGRAREIAALHDKTRELLECRKRQAEFDGRKAEIEAAEARLAASQRAVTIMPAIAAAERARDAAERERRAAADARAAAVKEAAREAEAAAAVEQAERSAAGVLAMRDRIAALQGIRGTVEARALALQRLEAARGDVGTARQALDKVRGELDRMDRVVGDLNGRLRDAEQALRGSGYEERLDDLGRRLAPLALRLQAARQRAEEARGDAARAASEAAEAVAAVERKAAEVQAARGKTQEAAARAAEAEAAYQNAHERHAALVLRRALRPGEACPVCEQVVRALPAAAPAPEVDSLRRSLEAARGAEAEARSSEAELQGAVAGLETMAARAGNNAREAAARVMEASRGLEEVERALIEAGAPAFDGEPGETVEARVLGASQRLAAARSVHTRLADEVRRLERDRDVAVEAARGKQAEADRLLETVERAERQVREVTNEVALLEKQIRAVTDHADPGAEVLELEGQVRALEDGLQAARAALTEVRAAWAAAQGAAEAAETSAEAAAREARHRLQEAEEAARAAGFAGIEEAKRAATPDEECTALRRTVEEHRVGRGAVAKRIEALAGDLGGREVSAEEMHEADRQAEAAREAAEAALRAVSTLEADHARTAERAARRADHEAEHAAIASEARIYRELAEELQNNRFQDFVLEEAFHDLTRGASDRLKEVTAGRYSLRYQEGGIVVVDHDNADEVRSADTLSGGETFLASLALALQLSEQIQQAAGAVLLESLFIDEGFGTLDAEALEAAAAAVESLRDSRRMVGIITHIRELADRLPCRIVVERRHEGSRVQVQVT